MTYPTFAVGDVLTANDMNSVGLWLVTKSSTISSGKILVENCFTTDFDSYQIVISDLLGNTAAMTEIELYTGTAYTSSGFYATRTQVQYNTTTVTGINSANNAGTCATGIVIDSANSSGGVIYIQNPWLQKRTTFQINGADPRPGGNGALYTAGFLNDNTRYTGLRLSASGANITGGTIRVYGYRN